jgi:peptidoglycan/LPS O-acetylase OafA/YrhL
LQAGNSSRPRRQDIELLRLLSAYGIVSFHASTRAADWAYSGLIAFLVLSVVLGGKAGAPDLATLRRRALRLLRPWALWFAVYGGLNLYRGDAFLPSPNGLLAAVLAGTSIHLWYLPCIFLLLSGLDVLKAHLPLRILSLAAGVLAIGLIAAAPWWRPITLQLSYPVLQWSDALAPVLVGVFLLGAAELRPTTRRLLSALIVLSALGVCAFEWIGVPFALGFVAVLLASSPCTAGLIRIDLRPLSDCTFGIYLLHPLVFAFLLEWNRVPEDWLPPVIFAIALIAVGLGKALAALLAQAWRRARTQAG